LEEPLSPRLKSVAPITVLALLSTAMLIGHARTAGPGACNGIHRGVPLRRSHAGRILDVHPPGQSGHTGLDQGPAALGSLRRRWEYSHASGAVLNRVAFGSAVLATLWS
jgi:hypothetical protein